MVKLRGNQDGNTVISNSRSMDEMESIISLHTHMIKMIGRGDSLHDILRELTLKLEQHFKRTTYCTLLLTIDDNRLSVEHAPNLPIEYRQAIHLLKAGPKAGSCGTAVHRKEMVIVSEIENDSLWEDYRADALRFGLKACWSIPILIDRRVVGTFGIYHTEVCTPEAYEIEMLDTCANLAGFAIERDQRIKLEQQLQESEQRFKSLFDYYPHSIYTLSLTGQFLGFNTTRKSVTGYDKKELLGTSFRPLVHPADSERVHHHFDQAKKGIVQHYEARFVHKNGHEIILSITNIPIVVKHKVVGVYGITRDITLEKQMEFELHAAHQEMDHLFKNHQGMIFKYKKVNGQFIHTFCEGQLVERFGLRAEESNGQFLLCEFVNPEFASLHEIYHEEAWNGQETGYEGELNGIHFIATMKPIWRDGKVIEVIVSCNDITELKKAHEELRETKELLESLVNNTADAIAIMNVEGNLTYVNQAYVNLFGWQEEELLGKEVPNIPEQHKVKFDRYSREILSEKEVRRFDTDRQSKDGRLIPVSVTQSPTKDKNGKVNGTSAIIRDITERKRIERELEENRQHYQSLFYANPDLVYSMDVNGVLLNANLSMLQVLGYTLEEVKGVVYEKFLDEQSLRENKHYFEQALQGNSKTYETMGVHKNGHRIMLQLTNIPIIVNDQIVGVHAIAKDITERKRSQNEVLHLKQQLELVLNSVGDGIFVIDGDMKIKLINAAGARLCDYEVNELIGKSPIETFRHCNALEFCMPYQTLLDGKIRYVTDELFYRKDGTSFPAEYVASPVRENGTISGVVVAFRDTFEKNLAEEYLLKSAKLDMAGQLAAGVAHEIRNPLTSISGFIQLMEVTDKIEPEYFSIIKMEFDRIEGIIGEFLALAKPQAVKFLEDDVGLILEQTIRLMNSQATMQGIKVVSDIEASLPLIQCDKHQLKQVFINVIKNAIEATPSTGQLEITCKATTSHIHIVFQDQGTGIPKERIQHLFEPFYSTKEKGTGLGLMISYKIIEEHKGTMWVESEEGKGTAVQVLIPIAH